MISPRISPLGNLNLNSILFSSDPMPVDNYTSPTPEKFEKEILRLIKKKIKMERVSSQLKKEIQIFYGRMYLQVEKANLYREARDFYSSLYKLSRKKDLWGILTKFNNLTEKNRDIVLSMASSPSLIRLLVTQKNITDHSEREIFNAFKPTFSDLNSKRLGFISENELIRFLLTEEIDKFLIKSSKLYGTRLSLYDQGFIVDHGGQDESIAKAGTRFRGVGVEFIKFIDNYYGLKGLLDRPTTYSEKNFIPI